MSSLNFIPGTTITSSWLNGVDRAVYGADSLAGLRLINKPDAGVAIFVRGYALAGDGGGGFYVYDPSDTTSVDNNGSIIVGADGARYKLQNLSAISVTAFGASPAASSATNTTAFNAANAYAIANKVPVLIPATGTFKINRLTPVTGSLAWVGTDRRGSIVQLDSTTWPYTSSSVALISGTGSFRAANMTLDNNWIYTIHTSPAGYNDGLNPKLWGGYWMIQFACATTDTFEFENVHFANPCRVALCTAVDALAGGAKVAKITNCTSNGLLSPSVCIFAAEAAGTFTATNNRNLQSTRWSDGPTLGLNGGSAVYPWNGMDVVINQNTFIGHQIVCRGPLSLPWIANRFYSVGDEYTQANNAYRVVTAYTSGASYGSTDTANNTPIGLFQRYLQLTNNIIDTPIADTAVYGWSRINVDGNQIFHSGDMGIAISSSGYYSVCNNVIDGVRVGGIDASGGAVGVIANNVIKDVARGSGTFSGIDYSRIDVFGRLASSGGFALAGITLNAATLPASANVAITGNTIYMESLPPVSDTSGAIRANVWGIFNQTSSNPSFQNTTAITGNFVQDLTASGMNNFFISAPTLRFNSSAKSGTPVGGEVFVNGSTKWVYVTDYGAGNFVFIRKLTGALVLPNSTVFTGQTSGATITTSAGASTLYIGCTEAGNNDSTSKALA